MSWERFFVFKIRGEYVMKKSLKHFFTILIVIITFSMVYTGCGLKIGYRSSSSVRKMSASFSLLSDTEFKSIKLKEGNTITFDYNLKQKSGSLVATFEDSSGNELIEFEPNTSGETDITVDKDDTYKLIIKGDKAKGSYKFEWNIE